MSSEVNLLHAFHVHNRLYQRRSLARDPLNALRGIQQDVPVLQPGQNSGQELHSVQRFEQMDFDLRAQVSFKVPVFLQGPVDPRGGNFHEIIVIILDQRPDRLMVCLAVIQGNAFRTVDINPQIFPCGFLIQAYIHQFISHLVCCLSAAGLDPA